MTRWAKLLIVLMLILSIAFAAMSAVVFSRRQDWRKSYKDLRGQFTQDQNRKKGEIENLEHALEVSNAAVSTLSSDLAFQKASVEDFGRKLDNANADNTTLKREREAAQLATKDAAAAQLFLATQNGLLLSDNKTLASKNAELSNNIIALNEKADGLEQARKSLEDANDEFMVKLASANEVLSGHEAIFSELSVRNIEARQLIAAVTPIPAVDAKVMSVNPAVDIVILNKGRNQGVNKNYDFTIWRGDKYVATVNVFDLQENMSAARIQTQVMPVAQGDNASTRMR